MYPTILNVVVDAVVCHWVLMVADLAEVPYGWGRKLLRCATLLYSYYGLLFSTDPDCLHGEFDTFTGLFDRVGLWKNVVNMFRVLC